MKSMKNEAVSNLLSDCAREARAHDSAFPDLLKACGGMIAWQINRMAPRAAKTDWRLDLEAACNLAVWRALNTWDEKRAEFSTHLFYQLTRAVCDTLPLISTVRVPRQSRFENDRRRAWNDAAEIDTIFDLAGPEEENKTDFSDAIESALSRLSPAQRSACESVMAQENKTGNTKQAAYSAFSAARRKLLRAPELQGLWPVAKTQKTRRPRGSYF